MSEQPTDAPEAWKCDKCGEFAFTFAWDGPTDAPICPSGCSDTTFAEATGLDVLFLTQRVDELEVERDEAKGSLRALGEALRPFLTLTETEGGVDDVDQRRD